MLTALLATFSGDLMVMSGHSVMLMRRGDRCNGHEAATVPYPLTRLSSGAGAERARSELH